MSAKKVIRWRDKKPELVAAPLQDYNETRYLIYGYIRRMRFKWIISKSIFDLIIAYYPQKYNIYAIGLNENGELGLSLDNSSISKFTKLHNLMSICDDLYDVHQNRSKLFIKTFRNNIYCSDYKHSSKGFKKINDRSNLSFIHLISNGLTSGHTFFVSSTNKIFAFGLNDNGQFGNGDKSDFDKHYSSMLPLTKLNKFFGDIKRNKIIKISTGLNHTLFLTISGFVWSCGKNNFGQCGIQRRFRGNTESLILTPVLVPKLSQIIDIECGLCHNLCIKSETDSRNYEYNELWVFGYNRFGQCGLTGNKIIDIPIYNDFFKFLNLKKLSCGKSHSFVIDDTGKCWIFGRNLEGQIGIGIANYSSVKIPNLFQNQEDEELKDIIIIDGSCGYWHTMLLTNKHQIYGFGNNKHHAISQQHIEEEIVCPYLLTKKEIGINKNERVLRVICGDQTSIIITQ